MRKRLLDFRMQKGLTQEQVAEKIGVAVTTVSRWETGETRLRSHSKIQLCEVYGIPLETLEHELSSVPGGKADLPQTTQRPSSSGKTEKYISTNSLTHLIDIVYMAHPTIEHLQSMLQETIEERFAMNAENNVFSCQEALKLLMLYPLLLKNRRTHCSTEETLHLLASGITACGFLMSRDYEEIKRAFSLLSEYVLTLTSLLENASSIQVRKEILGLMGQCLLLKSTFADLFEGPFKQIAYAQQAAVYAKEKGDVILSIAAHQVLSVVHYDNYMYVKALQACEKACYLMAQRQKVPLPGIVQSWVYVGLAKYQACFHKAETYKTLASGLDAFEDRKSSSASLLTLFNHDKANVLRQAAMVSYHLREYEKAWNIYEQLLDLSCAEIPSKVSTSMRGYLTALCEASLTSLKLPEKDREQEIVIQLFKRGLDLARQLHSRWHFHILMNTYTGMEMLWPDSHAIHELRDVINQDL